MPETNEVKLLSETLKDRTLNNHQRAEKAVTAMIRQISSVEDYVHVLQIFHGYFGAVEKKLNLFITSDHLPDHNKRRKTDLLRSDISSHNGQIPDLACESFVPEMENHLQAFGALYVLEGSTLGGPYIAKMIEKKLLTHPENSSPSLGFFLGYKEDTISKWNDFKKALNALVLNSGEGEIVIRAANETFDAFYRWIISQHRVPAV